MAAVQQHLTLHLYDNAKFLCERLVASFPSEVGNLQTDWKGLSLLGPAQELARLPKVRRHRLFPSCLGNPLGSCVC